jgi:hypothetical protein
MVRKGLLVIGLALIAVLLMLPAGASVAQGPGELVLPAGAIKLSDAIPHMGEHWA